MSTASSSMIQSSSTDRLPGDDVQDEEKSECDLTVELQIGRKFNLSLIHSMTKLKNYWTSLKPLVTPYSQSVEEYNRDK